MPDDKQPPRLPEPGEFVPSEGLFLRVEVIPPPPAPPPVRVFVFRDVDYQMRVRRRGKTLQTGSTLCDFYRPGSGLEEVLQDTKAYCEREEILPDGEIEAVIVRTVRVRWRVPEGRGEGCIYGGRRFVNFAEYKGPGAPSPYDTEETDVWTSRRPDEEPLPLPEPQ
jgi:hypothetical protein